MTRERTGNAVLDAWADAFAPFVTSATSVEAPETFFDAVTKTAEPWSEFVRRSLALAGAMGSLANAGDPLGRALEESFSVAGQPGGAGFDVAAALAASATATTALAPAREAYQTVIARAWQRAVSEIGREVLAKAAAGSPVTTPAQWLALANGVADRVFVAAFHSDEYVAAQRRLSNALADQHAADAKLVELFASFAHVPTRAAFDELSREVVELRRRVRCLERAKRARNEMRDG